MKHFEYALPASEAPTTPCLYNFSFASKPPSRSMNDNNNAASLIPGSAFTTKLPILLSSPPLSPRDTTWMKPCIKRDLESLDLDHAVCNDLDMDCSEDSTDSRNENPRAIKKAKYFDPIESIVDGVRSDPATPQPIVGGVASLSIQNNPFTAFQHTQQQLRQGHGSLSQFGSSRQQPSPGIEHSHQDLQHQSTQFPSHPNTSFAFPSPVNSSFCYDGGISSSRSSISSNDSIQQHHSINTPASRLLMSNNNMHYSHSIEHQEDTEDTNRLKSSMFQMQFRMGYRSTCEKCVNRVPGHFSHLD